MGSLLVGQALERWRELRAEYELVLEAAYVKAETETNGKMLNDRGRDAGIDPYSLFMGNAARAYAYASPELVEHWAHHPRVTYADYERQMIE